MLLRASRTIRTPFALHGALAAMVAFAFALAPGTGAQTRSQIAPVQAAPMKFGALVRPDTVQVGDPFIMTVTVEVPVAAQVTWPTPADTNGPVEMRAGVRVTSTENGAVRRETAEYSLVAWGVGAVAIDLPDILVRENDRQSVIPFRTPSVFVASVLPADTSLHVPKPAKALFPRIIPWWEVWWPALLVLLLLLLLAIFVIRHRRKRFVRVELDPFARAERDFQRLDKLALTEAGEQGRFVALAVEVLRTYLSVRIASASLALTSEELLSVVAHDSRVPIPRLTRLLNEADAIKFGQHPVDGEHARALAVETRGVVSAVERAEQARLAAAKSAERKNKKDTKKNMRETRRIAEEKARVESRRGKSEAA